MTPSTAAIPALERLDDPWSIPLGDRTALRAQFAQEQSHWLPRIQALVEPPHPTDAFPAFLLAAPRLTRLREAIAEATGRRDLDIGTADELQRFVDVYTPYFSCSDSGVMTGASQTPRRHT